MNLFTLLERRGAAIVDDAQCAMERAHLAHYERSGEEVTRERLEALYGAMTASIHARTLAAVESHAVAIAEERYRANFGLGEVQTAFNVLEESLWNHVTREVDPSALAESLALVTTALGAGKDALARHYVSLATRTQAPALNLAALFAR